MAGEISWRPIRMAHPIYLIIEFLYQSNFSMNIYMGHKYLQPFTIWRDLAAYFFLRCLFSPTFQSCSLQVLDHAPSPLAMAYKESHIWLFLFPNKMCNYVYCLKLCSCEDFPLTVSFRVAQRKVVMGQLSTSGWWQYTARKHQ